MRERHQPRPHAARPIPVLALRHVEFRMAHPIADRAVVAQRQRCDMAQRLRLRYPPPACADHHGNLALIIQLQAFRRADQRLAMPGETARKPRKQGHMPRRLLPILVFCVAVRKIHPHADDLFGVRHRHLPDEIAVGMGDLTPRCRLHHLRHRPRRNHLPQAAPLRKCVRQRHHTLCPRHTPNLRAPRRNRRQPQAHRPPRPSFSLCLNTQIQHQPPHPRIK